MQFDDDDDDDDDALSHNDAKCSRCVTLTMAVLSLLHDKPGPRQAKRGAQGPDGVCCRILRIAKFVPSNDCTLALQIFPTTSLPASLSL